MEDQRSVSCKRFPKTCQVFLRQTAKGCQYWLFFREGDDFEPAFKELMRVMDTDLEWVKAHTRLTVRAVE